MQTASRQEKGRGKGIRGPTYLVVRKDPVKLTALLYFREALLGERYEECPEFIRVAREFGAQALEIQELIEDARRLPR